MFIRPMTPRYSSQTKHKTPNNKEVPTWDHDNDGNQSERCGIIILTIMNKNKDHNNDNVGYQSGEALS